MNSSSPEGSWIALSTLRARLEANLLALQERERALAQQLRSFQPGRDYCIQLSPETVILGVQYPDGIRPLPAILPPAHAAQIANRIFNAGKYNQSLLIAGEDLGWLFNRVYQLPIESFPMHHRPLFLLMKDLERLWVILHVQDWRIPLADGRVRLFVGPEAFSEFQKSLTEDIMTWWPSVSVTADPSIWPADMALEHVLKEALVVLERKQAALESEAKTIYEGRSPQSLAKKLQSGEPLNILGVCSRHSVFVNYSMGDWLTSFERLGHRVRVVTESAAHQCLHKTTITQAVVDFKPDVVLMINHYRKEMSVVPAQAAFVMWAQDWTENMASSEAGAAQGPLDYVLGHNPTRMARTFGYPLSRYMPAVVAVNDQRFKPCKLSENDLRHYACDASFVSNVSSSADSLLMREIQRIGSPECGRLLTAIYDQLKAVYESGSSVTGHHVILAMIDRAMLDTGIRMTPGQLPALRDFFTHSINSALFRHQSLQWLAEMGLDLRLYGRGWEKHPTLGRFARGVADNQTQLSLVFQASRINLQISPHGVMHQRVLDGLSAGGFFMFRHCSGDVVGREFAAVWDWCVAHQIQNDKQLLQHATEPIKARLAEIKRLLARDPFVEPSESFVELLQFQSESGHLHSAGLLWGEDYDAVAYGSAEELMGKIRYFLANPEERSRRTESMRKPVLDRYTYLATTRRLFNFIAADLAGESQARAAA